MAATGIPGLAAAVVYDGEVRYLEGRGVRAVGEPAKVDADTVFYLASLSKPISSTVVGAAMSRTTAEISWQDTIASHLPGFTLSDPWVGDHVTVADMFSHRSGLPDHSGNLMEDLGYDRAQILTKLRYYPLASFRDSYAYTNYGLTAGAQAIAVATGRPWATLAKQMIFEPLGMRSSSFTYADLESRKNRVALHRKVHGRYVAGPDADYEPQAPAGSASSSIRDMATWATMLLAGGKHRGATLVDPKRLNEIWSPASVSHPTPQVGMWSTFYGYGWNVSYQMTGELQVGHSGAFARGAATSVTMFPTDKLAIIVLTNAFPQGVPEAITAEFVDFVRYGHSTQKSWLDVIAPYFEEKPTADQKKYSKPAPHPEPARDLTAYLGSYQNAAFGELTVSLRGGRLRFTVGPNHEQHALEHYSGDEFFFETTGEDATGFSGALFDGTSSRIRSLTINAWNHEGLGTFRRS
jgi:CubicO group peptidase (beta-lactamase class C family)